MHNCVNTTSKIFIPIQSTIQPSSFLLSLDYSQSAATMPTYAHQRQSDLIYSHRTISAYVTANQHQSCQLMNIRDYLTSSNIIIPSQPRMQPIRTNHVNLYTSETIWPHLQSPYHICLYHCRSVPVIPTYAQKGHSDII